VIEKPTYEQLEARAKVLVEHEIEHKLMEEKLKNNEKRLRFLLDSTPDMVLEVDKDLNILWANKAALDLNSDAIGQTCYVAFPGNDSVCEGCFCVKTFETGEIEKGTFYQPNSKTAGQSYWENIAVPLKDADENIPSVLIISRNASDRIQAELEKENLIKELKAALAEVKVLSGLLPICCNCKQIRDDNGYWNQIDSYLQNHSAVKFTHGLCPECAKELYPDLDIHDD